jgi:hypothetical protein
MDPKELKIQIALGSISTKEKIKLINNPNTPIPVLIQLSNDSNFWIKRWAHDEILIKLKGSMNKEINAAAQAIVMEYIDIPGHELEFVVKQVSDTIARETRLIQLLNALKKAKVFYEGVFESTGGCDHSVDIRECEDRRDYEELCKLLE